MMSTAARSSTIRATKQLFGSTNMKRSIAFRDMMTAFQSKRPKVITCARRWMSDEALLANVNAFHPFYLEKLSSGTQDDLYEILHTDLTDFCKEEVDELQSPELKELCERMALSLDRLFSKDLVGSREGFANVQELSSEFSATKAKTVAEKILAARFALMSIVNTEWADPKKLHIKILPTWLSLIQTPEVQHALQCTCGGGTGVHGPGCTVIRSNNTEEVSAEMMRIKKEVVDLRHLLHTVLPEGTTLPLNSPSAGGAGSPSTPPVARNSSFPRITEEHRRKFHHMMAFHVGETGFKKYITGMTQA